MLKTYTLPIFLLFLTVAAGASANVSVKREPPDIQYKTFDPANPPAEMPHLEAGEAAATTNSFRVSANASYEPITRTKGENGWTTVVAVHGLTITLQLHIIVWLPKGATDKLKAHEEGHRKISEQVYQQRAVEAAKAAGALMDGKRFTGEGPNWKAAAGNAVESIVNEVGKEYLRRTADPANRVNDIYDALTQHGTNGKPEAEAIKEAFDREAGDHPLDQPGPTSRASSPR